MPVWLQRGGCETEPEADDCESVADLWLVGGSSLSREQSRLGEVGEEGEVGGGSSEPQRRHSRTQTRQRRG